MGARRPTISRSCIPIKQFWRSRFTLHPQSNIKATGHSTCNNDGWGSDLMKDLNRGWKFSPGTRVVGPVTIDPVSTGLTSTSSHWCRSRWIFPLLKSSPFISLYVQTNSAIVQRFCRKAPPSRKKPIQILLAAPSFGQIFTIWPTNVHSTSSTRQISLLGQWRVTYCITT